MAQHDYSIANQAGLAFRQDLNNALAAIVSQNSGANEPSTTFAYQLWADTTAGVLKVRNTSNSGWITLRSLDGLGHLNLPSGTTGDRPGAPASGMIRFNTSLGRFEGYNGTSWGQIGAGATGGGSDAVFIENGQVVTIDYTLTSGKNAVSAGPITINTGVTVTVPSGASWVVV